MTSELVANRLAELAAVANEEHELAIGALRRGLQHAIAAGAALNEAKDRVDHGEWTEWLRNNYRGSARSASDYMRVAKARALFESQRAANMSIRAALEMLPKRTRRNAEKAQRYADVRQLCTKPAEAKPAPTTKPTPNPTTKPAPTPATKRAKPAEQVVTAVHVAEERPERVVAVEVIEPKQPKLFPSVRRANVDGYLADLHELHREIVSVREIMTDAERAECAEKLRAMLRVVESDWSDAEAAE